MNDNLPSIKILGTKITTAKKSEILEYIFKCIEEKSKKLYIVTPNPEILVYATCSSSFKKVLNDAGVSLPDGVGLLLAGNILKKHRFTRITGVDMMETLCAESSKRDITVGFLGGRDGVAEMTAERLVKKYPDLRVNFIGEEWDGSSTGPAAPHTHSSSSPRTSFKLRVDNGSPPVASPVSQASSASHPFPTKPDSHIDILFVAFGFPRQEEWIAKNLPDIDVTVAMGVGGAFDYISGKVDRAPKVFRDHGLEWAYRLVRQPWRAKRQLALPVFVYKVMKEKFF